MAIDMNASRTRFETIDEYIDIFPPNVKTILEGIRKTIRDSAPDAQETIAYHIPTFKLNGNLVHFAGYKNHVDFYPSGPLAIEAFKDEMFQYEQSKGTIRFPLDQPILLELVKRIVKFRVQQNESRKRSKAQA